jgi:DNA-binding CsgD family transcriptional regulator
VVIQAELLAAANAGFATMAAGGRLRDVGRPLRRSHRRPVVGWASLTQTEARISDLVALGLTNIEVAERMFLSRHTVDFHLRQVFRKLQVNSRVELTRLSLQRNN